MGGNVSVAWRRVALARETVGRAMPAEAARDMSVAGSKRSMSFAEAGHSMGRNMSFAESRRPMSFAEARRPMSVAEAGQSMGRNMSFAEARRTMGNSMSKAVTRRDV